MHLLVENDFKNLLLILPPNLKENEGSAIRMTLHKRQRLMTNKDRSIEKLCSSGVMKCNENRAATTGVVPLDVVIADVGLISKI